MRMHANETNHTNGCSILYHLQKHLYTGIVNSRIITNQFII